MPTSASGTPPEGYTRGSGEDVDRLPHTASVHTQRPPRGSFRPSPSPSNSDTDATATSSSSGSSDSSSDSSGSDGEEVSNPHGLPHILLLRHRMGYSTVRLSRRQLRHYTWSDLEDYVLYKEQKYSGVNVLWRASLLLYMWMLLTVCTFAFAASSTSWRAVQYVGHYQAIGLFVSCSERLSRQCVARQSALLLRATLADAVTGEEVCRRGPSASRGYIGAMWALAILVLAAQLAKVVGGARLVLRPTREVTLAVTAGCMLASAVCGVVVCVLFAFYTRCEGRTCDARHEGRDRCRTDYHWAYRLFIASVVMEAVGAFLALCVSSYISTIRANARRQLRRERRRLVAAEESPPKPRAERPASRPPSRRPSTSHVSFAPPAGRAAAAPQPPQARRPSKPPARRRHESEAARRARARERVAAAVLSRDYDDVYLTARDLGVTIAGADDWVYDERSDMYYSFAIRMFYDPLVGEYYNRALGCWQETPARIPRVRDAAAYTTRQPEEHLSELSEADEPEGAADAYAHER